MADKKKNRRKFDEAGKPTKQDYAVAKFLRFNVPAKEAKLHTMEVHCFFASAAIDALLKSKWSASKNAKEPLFFNRSSCVNYCQRLIAQGLFHRAERVQRKKDKGDRSKKKKIKDSVEKDGGGTGDELRERKSKKDKKEKKEEADSEKTTACEGEDDKKTEEIKEEKKDEKKKKEKPLKLVMTDDQRFLDGEENVYVWIYDPVSAKTLFIGSLIVFGAAALCLFPLWPEIVRVGVYYVSLTGAGFVGFILSLVVVRLILFCAVWLLTLGRHQFWLLPNLTEDVGFFESFKPLYKHDAALREEPPADKGKVKSKSESSPKAKEEAKKKDKSSDKEDSGSEQEFEMIDRGDLVGEEGGAEPGEKMEGEEESEGHAEEREEVEEEEADEEDEDEEYEDEDEDAPNDGLEEDYDEQEEDVDEEEEDGSETKKDK